jgi:uncharacterized glyoxalase superfamily protein PhnB
MIDAGKSKYVLASSTSTPPTSSSYWVVPDLLLAGAYPGDSDPDEHRRKIQTLVDADVRAFVNLMTEFQTPGSTLALHLADLPTQKNPSPDAIPAGTCQLSFAVDDLDAFHPEMIAKGVVCLQPPQKEDFGGRLAAYADPDGLPFCVGDKSEKIVMPMGAVVNHASQRKEEHHG